MEMLDIFSPAKLFPWMKREKQAECMVGAVHGAGVERKNLKNETTDETYCNIAVGWRCSLRHSTD